MTDLEPEPPAAPPVLGAPPGGADPADLAEPDFANEHQDTAVDPKIITDQDPGETESPHGWSGMDRTGFVD
jgi:hypothetical protein